MSNICLTKRRKLLKCLIDCYRINDLLIIFCLATCQIILTEILNLLFTHILFFSIIKLDLSKISYCFGVILNIKVYYISHMLFRSMVGVVCFCVLPIKMWNIGEGMRRDHTMHLLCSIICNGLV